MPAPCCCSEQLPSSPHPSTTHPPSHRRTVSQDFKADTRYSFLENGFLRSFASRETASSHCTACTHALTHCTKLAALLLRPATPTQANTICRRTGSGFRIYNTRNDDFLAAVRWAESPSSMAASSGTCNHALRQRAFHMRKRARASRCHIGRDPCRCPRCRRWASLLASRPALLRWQRTQARRRTRACPACWCCRGPCTAGPTP
jgi:hypothetical protein